MDKPAAQEIFYGDRQVISGQNLRFMYLSLIEYEIQENKRGF